MDVDLTHYWQEISRKYCIDRDEARSALAAELEHSAALQKRVEAQDAELGELRQKLAEKQAHTCETCDHDFIRRAGTGATQTNEKDGRNE